MDFENHISDIRALQGLKWYIACLSYVKFNLLVLIIWGDMEQHFCCLQQPVDLFGLFSISYIEFTNRAKTFQGKLPQILDISEVIKVEYHSRLSKTLKKVKAPMYGTFAL